MAKVLYITANPKAVEESFGLQVGEHFIEKYQEENSGDRVERLDLYKEYIPLIDETVLGAWGKLQKGQPLNEEEEAITSRMNQLLEQFLEADKYVFVTPMWNLSYPPKLKAFIDNIAIAGKTFKYTEEGPQGLLTDKKVVHVQARGGVYSEGPAMDFEFADKYLRGIMGFIGITDYTHIPVEGMNQYPDRVGEILSEAKDTAAAAVEGFSKDKVSQL
ncbi:FMN-dependent NADH-azoreductase [Alteribacter populi]|uniref:FMN-dependent NADH-azoreductase n=1 Tax=Alteribacter populi TaxID=2011011 RepID=UPI000BBAD3EF|nr:FMN-dependent NADH-azoreductase [Alteribacter populi]